MKDFDTFTKIAQECERFGHINCCQSLEKVAQSAKIAQSGHTSHTAHYQPNQNFNRLMDNGFPFCVAEGSTEVQCPCLENFSGAFCKECKEGYYNFPECSRNETNSFKLKISVDPGLYIKVDCT